MEPWRALEGPKSLAKPWRALQSLTGCLTEPHKGPIGLYTGFINPYKMKPCKVFQRPFIQLIEAFIKSLMKPYKTPANLSAGESELPSMINASEGAAENSQQARPQKVRPGGRPSLQGLISLLKPYQALSSVIGPHTVS